MKYHDTSTRNPVTGERNADQALIKWLETTLTDDVDELRLQTGYFRFEAVRALALSISRPTLRTTFLIGSNDGDTTFDEAHKLMVRLGIPRDNARLGVVSFASGLFHPKTYHVVRKDGSQAAFVGSCNFTPAGITLGNIEAAISVDTLDGDSPDVLNAIAAAIDNWFEAPLPEGVTVIENVADLQRLQDEGVLSATRPPRLSTTGRDKSGMNGSSGKPSLRKTIKLPAWPDEPEGPDDSELEIAEPKEAPEEEEPSGPSSGVHSTGSAGGYAGATSGGAPFPGITTPPRPSVPTGPAAPPAPISSGLPVATIKGFPDYFLFEPGASAPTKDASVLTGASLPGGHAGLIIILNKDNARHFVGKPGTANISIPISVVGTIRFGVYGVHKRPYASVKLNTRYVSDTHVIEGPAPLKSSISGYGYTASESGHGDIRLVMPAAVGALTEKIKSLGFPVPKEGDVVLLEWPASGEHIFGLTFLARGSAPANTALALHQHADKHGLIVGGACWLPVGVAPAW